MKEEIVNFNVDDFDTFLRCLNAIKDYCTDVDIKNGMIRQRNDSTIVVFQINCIDILGVIDLPIINIKKTIDLIKIFSGNNVTLKIYTDESDVENGYYIFSDNDSSIKFDFPSREFLDNKYIPDEELEKIFVKNEENLIIDTNVSSMISERIKTITDIFDVEAVQIIFEKYNANIIAKNQSMDKVAKIYNNVSLNVEFDITSSAMISILSFCIDHDNDLDLKIYTDNSENIINILVNGNIDSIPLTIYSRSILSNYDK